MEIERLDHMEPLGATIAHGPTDWQIIQQDPEGKASLSLRGEWSGEPGGLVQVRLVREDTSAPVSSSLDWQDTETTPDGRWFHTLPGVPAGGLYRLETRYNGRDNPAGEWASRGDLRHFLGVGDLWVIAGQSNAAGFGRGPVDDPPELGIHVFRNSECWALATHPLNESTEARHAANREAANPGHSPYLHCARLLKRALGYPIGLLPTALGGSPLSAWNPREPGPASLFENMCHIVERAGGRVKGILWYQGESDADLLMAPGYALRFADAVAAWREALSAPELPVLTAQINRYYTAGTEEADRGWTMLREAQRQAAATIPGVVVVPTLDLPLSDLIHTGPSGNLLLADRLAQAALGAVYGRAVVYRAPEAVEARRMEGDRAVLLRFAPVTSRMDNIDVTAQPFRVEDDAGEVPVSQVLYPGGARVQLLLGRDLGEHPVVHGAYGLAPDTAPVDMERLMPMLGFYGLKVE
ncbi:MAG: sialate O-acetylesterase [Anaerolineae bacterium]